MLTWEAAAAACNNCGNTAKVLLCAAPVPLRSAAAGNRLAAVGWGAVVGGQFVGSWGLAVAAAAAATRLCRLPSCPKLNVTGG